MIRSWTGSAQKRSRLLSKSPMNKLVRQKRNVQEAIDWLMEQCLTPKPKLALLKRPKHLI